MNNKRLQDLVKLGYADWKETPEDETVWKDITSKIYDELSQNLDETINYCDTCNSEELFFISQVFEELSEHFKSQKLIECVERNVFRFSDKELQDQLKMELEYMKMYV